MCISGTKNYNKTNLDVHFCFYLRCARVPKSGWNPWAFSILWSLLFEQHVPKEECFLDAMYSAWMCSRTACSWIGGSSSPELRTQSCTLGPINLAQRQQSAPAPAPGLLLLFLHFSASVLPTLLCCNPSPPFFLPTTPLLFVFHCLRNPLKEEERRSWCCSSVCRCQRLPKDLGDLHWESVPPIRNI